MTTVARIDETEARSLVDAWLNTPRAGPDQVPPRPRRGGRRAKWAVT